MSKNYVSEVESCLLKQMYFAGLRICIFQKDYNDKFDSTPRWATSRIARGKDKTQEIKDKDLPQN